MTATENKTMATGTILVEKVKYKNVRFYTIIIIIIINRKRGGKREGGREGEEQKEKGKLVDYNSMLEGGRIK